MAIALATATVGLAGALLLGRPLVGLEVANQRVEGCFRSELVLSENDVSNDADFRSTLRRVRANYVALYRVTAVLNLFLSILEQAVLLVPLVLVAPRVATGEVSLGLLIQASDAFARVFSAFSVLADHVPAINDFVSVYVRIREFERCALVQTPARAGHGAHDDGPRTDNSPSRASREASAVAVGQFPLEFTDVELEDAT